MSTAQFLAADPKVSAWVVASAGTGKTKVLTDRILNLLLQGFAPERILCLTFTKAAASEMANRLMKRLAHWATLPELELKRDLQEISSETIISLQLISRARQLFTLVLDAPGGMKIQTIHGFCQSVLSRFPIEAGIPPHFRVLDDLLAEELWLEAQRRVFAKPSSLADAALSTLNPYMADQRFSSILNDFYYDRSRIEVLLKRYDNLWDYATELLAFLEVDKRLENPEELLQPDLISRLKTQFEPFETDFEAYIKTYLTQKNEIRKKLKPEQMPQAERVYQFVRSLSALEVVQRTIATLALFQEIIQDYQHQKSRRSVLDYDDLIQKTQNLLNQPGIAAWVLYKLDGGIDHLLVDEAQDTNADQWDIILSLTSEFFTQNKSRRTIFAVGDPKQSIYSFQGANPEDFLKIKDHFSQLSQKGGQNWRDVRLDLSYRSTATILNIVDEVFANDQNKKGICFDSSDIIHHAHREPSIAHLPSLVELWPLIEPEEDDGELGELEWHLPLERVDRASPQSRLAHYLAEQVESWIHAKGLLPSTHQPIQPRDILILVRKRSILGQEIIRALKKRNIPVAGADRLILSDHIAVMDLLALGQFSVLPEDDLSLASILRSPLIGMSEDDLFSLAHGRPGTLWASLSKNAQEKLSFQEAYIWLKACLREVDLCPVYEFYSWVLTQQEGRCRFLSRLGHEVEDALEEFLSLCLNYDQEHAGSLQGFIHFMTHQTQEIKRDTSDTIHNQVRLMTVHGSKGLQAPIVILPEAAESGKERADSLLWTDKLVMLRPTQVQDTADTKYFKDKEWQATTEERRRLLYVALTRAQDRLYVGGWKSARELAKDCWYQVIKDALYIKSESNVYSHDQQILPPDINTFNSSEAFVEDVLTLPEWALTSPLEMPKTLNDSQWEKSYSLKAIERGILIHRLFEYLPELETHLRYGKACQIIEKEGLLISDWQSDIETTLKILNDPNLADIFGPHSLAEVPVSGVVDGIPFQGRIDRLHVTEETLTIIDYKSDQNPAGSAEDIPDTYKRQLEGYAAALKSIYPKHRIRKIILWTTGPKVQIL
ncbi:MAG: hypothetical protein FJX03_05805 [Alphaproteobacteria bacterium]|nr:hypothetical protein [Alphaproteobacteria bacterium]